MEDQNISERNKYFWYYDNQSHSLFVCKIFFYIAEMKIGAFQIA